MPRHVARICEELRRKVKEQGITDPALIKGLLAETVAEMLRGGQADCATLN